LKRVLILGIDGYIGWPLSQWLADESYEVWGADNLWRRKTADSVIPIDNNRRSGKNFDILNYSELTSLFEEFKPDAIIHLAEQPSAAWSMKSRIKCLNTHRNNVEGTLNVLYSMKEFTPKAHLIKLGTMGEYGTPTIPIEEDPDFPKKPGSWYHCTKVHDTHNIQFACRNWGLNATDIMQGVVYGAEAYGHQTRLDVDECFGTVINRFCAAAAMRIKLPVYGAGEQIRSFLPLEDSLQCIKLIIDNPAEGYRVVNQFDQCYSMNQLFDIIYSIKDVGKTFKFNPRHEVPHFYMPKASILKSLGYKPKGDMISVLKNLIKICKFHVNRIDLKNFYPEIDWK